MQKWEPCPPILKNKKSYFRDFHGVDEKYGSAFMLSIEKTGIFRQSRLFQNSAALIGYKLDDEFSYQIWAS